MHALAPTLERPVSPSTQPAQLKIGNPDSHQKGSLCGRLWSWGKNHVPGAAFAAGTVALGILRHTAPVLSATPFASALTAAGIGASALLAAELLLPKKVMDAAHQFITHNAGVTFFSLWQGYLNAGDDDSDEMTEQQKIVLTTIGTCVGAWTIVKIAMLAGRRLDEEDEDTALNQGFRPLGSSKKIEMFLEPETGSSLVVWQVAKGVAVAALLTIYGTGSSVSVHVRNIGVFLAGHVSGNLSYRIFEFVKGRIETRSRPQEQDDEWLENRPASAKFLKGSSRLFFLFGSNAIGALFFVNHPASYFFMGLLAAGTGAGAKHRFLKMPLQQEPEKFPRLQEIQNSADKVFAAGLAAWYVVAMSDKEATTADRLALSSFIVGVGSGYAAAKRIYRYFKPGENSPLFNSVYFYLLKHPIVFIIPPLYIIQHVPINDEALATSDPSLRVLQIVTWALYGNAFGIGGAQKIPRSQFPPEVDAFATKAMVLWAGGRSL